jgi:hypothetical protein
MALVLLGGAFRLFAEWVGHLSVQTWVQEGVRILLGSREGEWEPHEACDSKFEPLVDLLDHLQLL